MPSDTKGVGFVPRLHTDTAVSPLPFYQQELVIFLNPEETDRTRLISQPALEEMKPDKLSSDKAQLRNAMTGHTVTPATDK